MPFEVTALSGLSSDQYPLHLIQVDLVGSPPSRWREGRGETWRQQQAVIWLQLTQRC